MIVSVLIVLVLLNILIIVHEFGHFIFAKWSNALIQEFSIGLGPKIFQFKLMGTPSYVRLFPFGGYVSLIGEVEDEGPGSFIRLSLIKQLFIVLGGISFNIVLAYIIFFVLLIVRPNLYFPDIGISPYFATVSKNKSLLVISSIENESNIRKYIDNSELPVGLLKINNKYVTNFSELKNILKEYKSGDIVSITYCSLNNSTETAVKNCKLNNKTIKIKLLPNAKLGVLISKYSSVYWEYGSFPIVLRPILFSFDIGKVSYIFTKGIIKSVSAKHDYKVLEYTVGGPISIIPVVSNIITAKTNIIFQLAFLLGLFSLNLAFINAIPFPGLDGWHVILIFVRKIFPNVNLNRFLKFITTVGLLLLFLLAIIITLKDINIVFINNGK